MSFCFHLAEMDTFLDTFLSIRSQASPPFPTDAMLHYADVPLIFSNLPLLDNFQTHSKGT